jgi:hypothetical protein
MFPVSENWLSFIGEYIGCHPTPVVKPHTSDMMAVKSGGDII